MHVVVGNSVSRSAAELDPEFRFKPESASHVPSYGQCGPVGGVAQRLGVHRRMVREAIGSALPKPRKKTERPRWKPKAAAEFVDAVLEADRKAPRKQRHTAHRIWERIPARATPGA